MSKPIENCPVEEKPMRDRAWTAEQVEFKAEFQRSIGNDSTAAMLRAFAATLRQQAALAQNAQPKTLGDFVRLPDSERVAIGQQVVDRAIEMQKEVIARAQAQRAQDAQGEAVAWQRRIKHDGYKWFKWENFNSVVDYESPADFPKMVGRWECEYRPLYLHAERARVPAEVGEAGAMPGTSGFTMACFKASDVPIGTKLYVVDLPVNYLAAPSQPEDAA